MASLDVLTEEPPPSRTSDYELDFLPSLHLRNPILAKGFPNVNFPSGSKINPEILILGTCPTSSFLLEELRTTSQCILAQIVLPSSHFFHGYSTLDDEVNAGDNRTFDFFSIGESPSVAVSICHGSIPSESCIEWTRAMFGLFNPSRVVIIGSLASGFFHGNSLPASRVFKLETNRWKAAEETESENVPYLPTGNVVDGLPAAILTYCENRSMSAQLLVCVTTSLSVDESLVDALSKVVWPYLTVSNGKESDILDRKTCVAKAAERSRKKRHLLPTSDLYI